MDSVRSAEKLRRKNRRVFQDLRFDQLNFRNQEEKSPSSRFDSIKTSPEPETIPKHWAIVSEGKPQYKKGFPPGVTVDELQKYARRKQLTHLRPQDNLQLEEGSLKSYKSEYKRSFLPFGLPKVFQTSEPNSEENVNRDVETLLKQHDSSFDYFLGRSVLRRPKNNLFILKDQPMESLTEKNSKYIPFPEYERRKLLRRSTALKPEGEITSETEVRKEYVGYKNPEKARPIRKLPSLKVEGELQPLMTEQRDKFIAYLLSRRPVLEKKKTSLRMEGNFDFLTEKKLSYVSHDFTERPRIRKRSTSLKLEGEVEFFPEYRNNFVDFPRSRPVTYKPNGKIRHEGEFENKTETKTQFVNFENVSVPQSAKPENNLHIEGEMEISPEYRNNFIDFPRERPFLRRPFNQLRPEGNLELLTESSEKFSNFGGVGKTDGLQSPPNSNLKKDVQFSSDNVENMKKDEIPLRLEVPKVDSNANLEVEADLMTEKPDRITDIRPLSLKQEREFFFFPECRKSFRDHEKEKSQKHIKDFKSNLSLPRKKTPKEKLKFSFEDDKKSSVKRLKEATPEKFLTEIPRKTLIKSEGEKKKEARQILHFAEIPSDELLSPKEFPAFKVLDVKGQLGCQSMIKDVLENEKSMSDEDTPIYRLEVEGSPNFRESKRIFPDLGLDLKRLEDPEARTKQRGGNYVKVVRSPEIPNCLLEGNKSAGSRWRDSQKVCAQSPQKNLCGRSFMVLEKKDVDQNAVETRQEIIEREKGSWMPDSMDSLLA